MARCWCARSRSASAAPTAKSSTGHYGWAPPGAERLILGHESLGGVEEAPRGCGFAARRPGRRHRAPARSGAVPDLRRRRVGHVPQRPIHRTRHQAAQRLRQRAFRIEPDFVVKVDPALGELGVLLEPASVVAKAWEHVEPSAPAARLAAARRARHRRRSGRPAGGADGRAARPGDARVRPRTRRAQAGSGARPRRDLSHRRSRRRSSPTS